MLHSLHISIAKGAQGDMTEHPPLHHQVAASPHTELWGSTRKHVGPESLEQGLQGRWGMAELLRVWLLCLDVHCCPLPRADAAMGSKNPQSLPSQWGEILHSPLECPPLGLPHTRCCCYHTGRGEATPQMQSTQVGPTPSHS